MPATGRAQVLAFRAARQGLGERRRVAPGDLALYGRALIAAADDELGEQLGRQARP